MATRVDSPCTLLIEQAARLMGVSRRTVYNRIRDGRLQTIRTRCGSQRVVASSPEALRLEGKRKNRRTDGEIKSARGAAAVPRS